MRDDRFSWQPGDVKFTLSQCHNCVYGHIERCEKFGFKPDIYKLNEKPCPEKVAEET